MPVPSQNPPSLSPDEFRRAFFQMMADPESRRMILGAMVGTVYPIEGGTCSTVIADGTTTDGNLTRWSDAANCKITNSIVKQVSGNIGIDTTTPAAKLEVNDSFATTDGVVVGRDSSYNGIIRPYVSGKQIIIRDFSGNLGVVVEDGGNVGIGKLNQIVFLKPLGGTSDDQPQIQAAIDSLAASNGGIIYLLPGTYLIGSTIHVVSNGIKLRGYGGLWEKNPEFDASGTVTANTTTTVTGSGTHFLSEVTAGDIVFVVVSNIEYSATVSAVNSNTQITLVSAFGGLSGSHSPLTLIVQPAAGAQPTVALKWTGSASATEIMISLGNSTPHVAVQNLEISDVTIDGDGKAAIGLQLEQVQTSRFINVNARNMKLRATSPTGPSTGINLKTPDNGGTDTGWNLFENCAVDGASYGVVLDGGENHDTDHTTFIGLTVRSHGADASDVGVWLKGCDNNSFYRTWIQMDGMLGYGVLVNGGGGSPAYLVGYANYFYHLQPGINGLHVQNALAGPDFRNFIFGYDQSNGQADPTARDSIGNPVGADSVVSWTNSVGEMRGWQIVASKFDDFAAAILLNTSTPVVASQFAWVNNLCTVSTNNSDFRASDVCGVIKITRVNNNDWGYLIFGKSDTGGEEFNPRQQRWKLSAKITKSDTVNGGILRFGIFDDRGQQNSPNAMYFEAAATGSTPDWFVKSVIGGSSSSADTGIAAGDGAWHVLEMEALADARMIFRIDGTIVGTAITNSPDQWMTPAFEVIGNSSGVADMYIDWFLLQFTAS